MKEFIFITKIIKIKKKRNFTIKKSKGIYLLFLYLNECYKNSIFEELFTFYNDNEFVIFNSNEFEI